MLSTIVFLLGLAAVSANYYGVGHSFCPRYSLREAPHGCHYRWYNGYDHCPRYRLDCSCGDYRGSHCRANSCGHGERCVPFRRHCNTCPCPQFRCERDPCQHYRSPCHKCVAVRPTCHVEPCHLVARVYEIDNCHRSSCGSHGYHHCSTNRCHQKCHAFPRATCHVDRCDCRKHYYRLETGYVVSPHQCHGGYGGLNYFNYGYGYGYGHGYGHGHNHGYGHGYGHGHGHHGYGHHGNHRALVVRHGDYYGHGHHGHHGHNYGGYSHGYGCVSHYSRCDHNPCHRSSCGHYPKAVCHVDRCDCRKHYFRMHTGYIISPHQCSHGHGYGYGHGHGHGNGYGHVRSYGHSYGNHGYDRYYGGNNYAHHYYGHNNYGHNYGYSHGRNNNYYGNRYYGNDYYGGRRHNNHYGSRRNYGNDNYGHRRSYGRSYGCQNKRCGHRKY